MHLLKPFDATAFFLTLAILVNITGCDQAQNNFKPNIPSVSYVALTLETVTLTTELPGRIKACVVSEVRPQVSGIVQERLFIEGSDVKAGDVLYRIDPARYQAAYNNAQAELMTAKANLNAASLLEERYAALVKTSAISRQDYDNAKAAHAQVLAQIAAAQASLDAAAINLEYTQVKSPVSGRIGRSSVTPGALVTENQEMPLATVQQLDAMFVDVTQSSSEWLALKEAIATNAIKSGGDSAMQVSLLLENGRLYTQRAPTMSPEPGEALRNENENPLPESVAIKGRLELTDVTVNQSTGTITIRAIFPNPEGILLPGMYVRAIVEDGVKNDAILVPQKAVSRDHRGLAVAMVLKADDTLQSAEPVYRVEQRVLQISRSVGNRWLVNEGLQKGDLLLVEGSLRARNSQLVQGIPDNGQHSLAANNSVLLATRK